MILWAGQAHVHVHAHRPWSGGKGDDFVGGAGACTHGCMSTHNICSNTRASGATSNRNEARMSQTAGAHNEACMSGFMNADEGHTSGATSACNEGHASGAANAPNTCSAACANGAMRTSEAVHADAHVHAPASHSHSPVAIRPQPVVGCYPQAGVPCLIHITSCMCLMVHSSTLL